MFEDIFSFNKEDDINAKIENKNQTNFDFQGNNHFKKETRKDKTYWRNFQGLIEELRNSTADS